MVTKPKGHLGGSPSNGRSHSWCPGLLGQGPRAPGSQPADLGVHRELGLKLRHRRGTHSSTRSCLPSLRGGAGATVQGLRHLPCPRLTWVQSPACHTVPRSTKRIPEHCLGRPPKQTKEPNTFEEFSCENGSCGEGCI